MWGGGWQGDEGVGVGGWVDYSLRENAPMVSPIQKTARSEEPLRENAPVVSPIQKTARSAAPLHENAPMVSARCTPPHDVARTV